MLCTSTLLAAGVGGHGDAPDRRLFRCDDGGGRAEVKLPLGQEGRGRVPVSATVPVSAGGCCLTSERGEPHRVNRLSVASR